MDRQPRLPYLVHDAKRLDQQFYAGYDERFLYRKVNILGRVFEDAKELSSIAGVDTPEEHDRVRHALAAELLFTEFHQCECFFALLLAPFQELPHWIFLSTYRNREIKEKIQAFLNEDFKMLSAGLVDARDPFLRLAVYHGCQNSEAEEAEWQASFENLWWLLYRIGEKYLQGQEYNSYKHGLRVMSAASTLAASSNPRDFSKAFVMHSPYSICHLRLTPSSSGTEVSIETKGFNPTESVAHVCLMADILTNIRRIRYAALSGDQQVEVTLFSSMNREELRKLAVLQKWTFPA